MTGIQPFVILRKETGLFLAQTAMQTLSSGWIGPFVVTEKVSVVDYRTQLNPTEPSGTC